MIADSPEHQLDDLLLRWAHGWAKARGLEPVAVAPGVLEVPVANRRRDVELIVTHPTTELLLMLHRDYAPRGTVWLTSFASRFGDTHGLFALLDDSEHLMTSRLEPGVNTPHEGELAVEVDGHQVQVSIDGEDEPIASGRAGLVGTDLVFDQISTHPDHRRRGHGRAIMAALTEAGIDQGATDGLLVATVDGQALYSTLGWADLGKVATCVLVDDGPRRMVIE